MKQLAQDQNFQDRNSNDSSSYNLILALCINYALATLHNALSVAYILFVSISIYTQLSICMYTVAILYKYIRNHLFCLFLLFNFIYHTVDTYILKLDLFVCAYMCISHLTMNLLFIHET